MKHKNQAKGHWKISYWLKTDLLAFVKIEAKNFKTRKEAISKAKKLEKEKNVEDVLVFYKKIATDPDYYWM